LARVAEGLRESHRSRRSGDRWAGNPGTRSPAVAGLLPPGHDHQAQRGVGLPTLASSWSL